MWIKLELLKERDIDLEIIDFQVIGLIGYIIEKVKNKFERYKKTHTQFNLGIDLHYLLLVIGYNDIPPECLINLGGAAIKEIHKYDRNVANEMHFMKYLIRL